MADKNKKDSSDSDSDKDIGEKIVDKVKEKLGGKKPEEKKIGAGPVEAKKVANFPKGITLLLDTFNDDGALKKVSAYFAKKGVVKFQVWRPDGGNGRYFLTYEQPANSEVLGLGARDIPVTLETALVKKGDRIAITADKDSLAVGYVEAPETEFPCREPTAEKFDNKKFPYKFSVSATYSTK